ncbi:hypothetical protein [Diaphorobacter aerolatus]|uniref:Uncharacterized protein n=1 Tax=Diaphorobacter aerolatus TaxID=1288495 RepID=A0A7H0GJK0_9BURK|nr:hypothetical protein [Diaphorobacter aerolatus]QNP48466.1 hypothetical protein H9K75_21465 [Diaphorobacter aerolatus]
MLILRGLLGDAMAMGVVPVGLTNTAAHAAVQSQHADHEGHADQALVSDAGSSHAHHAPVVIAEVPSKHCSGTLASSPQDCPGGTAHHTASCSACDICNSSLHASAAFVLATAPAPQSLQAERSARFASAVAAQAVKPPIS